MSARPARILRSTERPEYFVFNGAAGALKGVHKMNVNTGVPGDFVLVDHALVREERGLGGIIHVEGPQELKIFKEGLDPASGAAARPLAPNGDTPG